MATPVIDVEHLDFYYDYKLPTQTYALKDINLQVGQGEYVVFFGPSGCGKTTLVYLIGGITTEKSGTGKINVNGSDILELSRAELATFRQTGIGIIFQNFNLIPSLTVLDNVALPMTFIGVPQDERREAAKKILARLNMDQYAHRFPAELSGGQQQRAGIARALANNPPVIIADEPLGNLDSENAEHVLKFLKELQEKDGRTVIMVTHEAWSVRDADRIVYMKDGSIIKSSVTERPAEKADQMLSISPNMFRELYPDLTQDEITIKALSNLLLRGYSADEIKRFEFFLNERFGGRITAKQFEEYLDRPYREDGVGLWKQRAVKIAELTEDILSQKQKLTDILARLEKHPEISLTHEITELRHWATKEYTGHLDDEQISRLNDAINDRLRGKTTPEEFRAQLNLSRSKQGVGLSMRSTQHIADRLESVLALGHMGGNVSEAIRVVSSHA